MFVLDQIIFFSWMVIDDVKFLTEKSSVDKIVCYLWIFEKHLEQESI